MTTVTIAIGDVNGTPHIQSVTPDTVEVSPNSQIQWTISSTSTATPFWVVIQDFYLDPQGVYTQTDINPTPFGAPVAYGEEITSGSPDPITSDTVTALSQTRWHYSVLLTNKDGVIDKTDPFVVLSGGGPAEE
jgi:hypothetical protein